MEIATATAPVLRMGSHVVESPKTKTLISVYVLPNDTCHSTTFFFIFDRPHGDRNAIFDRVAETIDKTLSGNHLASVRICG